MAFREYPQRQFIIDGATVKQLPRKIAPTEAGSHKPIRPIGPQARRRCLADSPQSTQEAYVTRIRTSKISEGD
jgi:hypothetical protein